MKVQRVFTGSFKFKTILQLHLEKEIEKIVNTDYNNKQVDMVANNSGGRQK